MIVYDIFIAIIAILVAILVASLIGSIALKQMYSKYSRDKVKNEAEITCQIIKLISLPLLVVLFLALAYYLLGL